MIKSIFVVALSHAVLQPFKFQGVTHRPPGPATFTPEDAAPLIAAGFLGEVSAADQAAADQAAADQAAADQAAADKAAAKKQAGKTVGKGGK